MCKYHRADLNVWCWRRLISLFHFAKNASRSVRFHTPVTRMAVYFSCILSVSNIR